MRKELERVAAGEERRRFIGMVENYCLMQGFCHISMTGLHFLDDPPVDLLEETLARLWEIESRGRDLPPPETLWGALKEMCDRRGWTLVSESVGTVMVLAKSVEVECRRCTGRGTLVLLEDILGAATDRVLLGKCPDCGGTGKRKRYE